MDYIFSPMRQITDATSNINADFYVDAEKYVQESFSKTVGLTYDYYKFEGELEAGVGAIILGFILLLTPTFELKKI